MVDDYFIESGYRGYFRSGIEIDSEYKGNIKEVSVKAYGLDSHTDFDISLLDFDDVNHGNYVITQYDKNKNVTKHDWKSPIAIKENGDYEYKKCTNIFNYEEGLLVGWSSLFSDSTEMKTSLKYNFDNEGRIIKTIMENNADKGAWVEEVEYLEDRKKITIYKERDSIRYRYEEYIFDSYDRLEFYSFGYPESGSENFSNCFFYDEEENVQSRIYESNLSPTTYNKYFYNKEGILKKTKTYLLKTKIKKGNEIYKGGKYLSKRVYKEKVEGGFILKTLKNKSRNSKKSYTQYILDHNRNKVLIYDASENETTIVVYKITYHDE